MGINPAGGLQAAVDAYSRIRTNTLDDLLKHNLKEAMNYIRVFLFSASKKVLKSIYCELAEKIIVLAEKLMDVQDDSLSLEFISPSNYLSTWTEPVTKLQELSQ